MALGWSELQIDLLHLIAERLALPELRPFGSVCSSWRSFVKDLLRLPWLILPYTKQGGDFSSLLSHRHIGLRFLNIFHNKTYNMDMPELHERYICGTSGGWLITFHYIRLEIQLLHPFHKNVVDLPMLSFLYRISGNIVKLPQLHSFKTFCPDLKVVTSSSNPYSVGFVAMALHVKDLFLFRRGKDNSWIKIAVEDDWYCLYEDIIFFKHNFYALRDSGEVDVVKGLDGPSPTISLFVKKHHGEYKRSSRFLYYLSSLVESSNDMLKVTPRSYNDIIDMEILKLDFNGLKWEKVKNLHDTQLFVNFNNSFSVPASDFPHGRGNRIYFSKEVFNLKDGSMEVLKTPYVTPHCTWFLPYLDT